MSPADDVAGIADASKPNAGRLYDYLLGGNHNFEIDRLAAEQLLKVLPEARELVRVIRWFLGEAVRRLIDEGYTKFLDFASGLPTVDHIHQIAPKGTKVIYSDIDPVTVAYAQEIITDHSDVKFLEVDVRQPEKLLKSGQIEEMFGDNENVVIGLNGIFYFMSDEDIANTVNLFYDWAGKGSKLYVSDTDVGDAKDDQIQAGVEFYKKLGQPYFPRTHEQTLKILGKWKPQDPGFLELEDWVGVDRIAPTDIGYLHLLGAILTK